jgi:hypothetical protein
MEAHHLREKGLVLSSLKKGGIRPRRPHHGHQRPDRAERPDLPPHDPHDM